MTTQLTSSIVRIRTVDGRAVGVGFLVAERQVLTCAHVVARVLDLPDDTPAAPEAEVHLDFPLIAPGHILTAHVIRWEPLRANGVGDVAGLELESDPPAGARAVRLVTSDDLWGHPFRAFGFPAGHHDGVYASGVMRGRQATGWVQIEDVNVAGFRVEPGFSGAPVLDERLEGVAGKGAQRGGAATAGLSTPPMGIGPALRRLLVGH